MNRGEIDGRGELVESLVFAAAAGDGTVGFGPVRWLVSLLVVSVLSFGVIGEREKSRGRRGRERDAEGIIALRPVKVYSGRGILLCRSEDVAFSCPLESMGRS